MKPSKTTIKKPSLVVTILAGLLAITTISQAQHIENVVLNNGLEVLRIEYFGNWVINSSGCNCSFSKTKGDRLRIEFIGTNIYYWGELVDAHGISAVFLDGVEYPSIDQYAAKDSIHFVQLAIKDLTYGNHVLEFVVTGEKNERSKGNWFVFRGVEVDNDPIDAISTVNYYNRQGEVTKDTVIYNIIPKDSITWNVIAKDCTVWNIIAKDCIAWSVIPKDCIAWNIINKDTTIYTPDSTLVCGDTLDPVYGDIILPDVDIECPVFDEMEAIIADQERELHNIRTILLIAGTVIIIISIIILAKV